VKRRIYACYKVVGDAYSEKGAFSRDRVELDSPPVFMNNSFCYSQSHAGSLWFGGKKRVKDKFTFGVSYSCSIVFNSQDCLIIIFMYKDIDFRTY